MTLDDLIAQYRRDTTDNVVPYLCSDEDLIALLNEAEEEAALRSNLIHDSTTAAVCQIAVVASTSVYALHEAVFQVTRATFSPTGSTADPIGLVLTDRLEQDRTRPGWRTVSEEPRHLIVDDTSVEIACLPNTGGTIDLEVYRAPLTPMAAAADTPEIGRAHHRFLPLWAEHRVYGRADADLNDPQRSANAEKAFTRQFGERPDAAMRRDFQANRPAFNKSYW